MRRILGSFVVKMDEMDTVEQPLKVTAEQLGVREGYVLSVRMHACGCCVHKSRLTRCTKGLAP